MEQTTTIIKDITHFHSYLNNSCFDLIINSLGIDFVIILDVNSLIQKNCFTKIFYVFKFYLILRVNQLLKLLIRHIVTAMAPKIAILIWMQFLNDIIKSNMALKLLRNFRVLGF